MHYYYRSYRIFCKRNLIIEKTEKKLLRVLGLMNIIRTMRQKTVVKWFDKFKRDEMSTEADARSRRINVKEFYKIIFDYRKMKLIEIAEILKILKERVGHIVRHISKLCAKWVPR